MRIGELATRQHGVVALRQLRALGLSDRTVRDRVRTGRLRRLHRGVYAVGHEALRREGRWLAAVLSCGAGAALSYRSAAVLHRLLDIEPGRIDVTAPRRPGRLSREIRPHRSRTLQQRDLTEVASIPCTAIARTLLDLASVANRRVLERAFDQAEIRGVLELDSLSDVLDRAGGHQGAPACRRLLALHRPTAGPTRSELERRFRELCRQSRIESPLVNHSIQLPERDLEVDFCWPARRLVVELDGHRFHGTRLAFERDRDRDQQLVMAGWRVVRFTWRQLRSDAAGVAATLQRLLAPSP